MAAIENLLGLVGSKGAYDIPYAELAAAQIEAAAERLKDRRSKVRLLANRADAAGLTTISELADLVPLLFAHTAYKSYAESWLTEGKWDRMGKWLETVSAYSVRDVDTTGVQGLDDWLEQLKPAGHFVACSSGTTGKPSMLTSAQADRDFAKRASVAALSWGANIEPNGDRWVFPMQPLSNNARALDIRFATADAFGSRDKLYALPIPPITIGKTSEMIALRRKIADGTARPAEVSAFESIASKRQADMDGALKDLAENLVARRGEKLLLVGMWANLFKAAEAVRALGYSGKDFDPDNALSVGGGLKGAQLPPDYREFVLETFNIRKQRVYLLYSMQEINTSFPMCSAGRYHVPPWVILLMLDKAGENLLDTRKGEVEGRAAFFDMSLDARWGGVISGDLISADFGRCACGHEGPSIKDSVTRYSDLPGGDKISCAGTIDAYVRGEV